MQKTVSLGMEASQAEMDNQSPVLCLLLSVRLISSPGAPLAGKEVALVRAEMGWCHWPVFEGVCCGLLCPGKAKLFLSAGRVLAQPEMSLIFSLVD